MKTIVIVGGGRNVGKTTLARRLCEFLPESVVVKLGHHPPKPGRPSHYFMIGTPFGEIASQLPEGKFLIVESGSVLDEPAFEPDLIIFLPTGDSAIGDKPGSARRRARAHVVRGETLTERRAGELAHRLGIGHETFHRLLKTVNSVHGSLD